MICLYKKVNQTFDLVEFNYANNGSIQTIMARIFSFAGTNSFQWGQCLCVFGVISFCALFYWRNGWFNEITIWQNVLQVICSGQSSGKTNNQITVSRWQKTLLIKISCWSLNQFGNEGKKSGTYSISARLLSETYVLAFIKLSRLTTCIPESDMIDIKTI